MIEIGVNNLKKTYGANTVFENVTFELQSNEIIGLIGRNGTGKTSLLKILMGDENYEGSISLRKGLKLSYLNQIPNVEENVTVMDVLLKAFDHLKQVKKQMTLLEKEMAKAVDEHLEKIMHQYSHVQTEFEILGGYDIDEKLSKIIGGLKLQHLVDLNFKALSGGEKTRVMLGEVLLEEPDVLLLDEPTNHLDIQMVTWLEDFLKKYKGSAIIISHDRYFLDRIVNKIYELHSDGIEEYHGNYSYYKIEKERRFDEAMKEFQNQQRKIKTMEEQIKRYRIWGKMRDSDKMYRRAKELEKRLSKIDRIDKPTTDNNINLSFEMQKRSGKRVYYLTNVCKSYSDKPILTDINLEILYQDCLTIIGENGSGKSTLLKIIHQQIEPDSGKVVLGASLKVGYLPQEIVFEDDQLTILETYQNEFLCTNLQARNALAKVLFTRDDVFKKVSVLSGGEKIRLKLLILMDQMVNVLLLDEPTNHLDIESREILEESLLNFNGTIIVISHDRYFINRFSSRIAEIKDRKIRIYDGDFDNYLEAKEQEENRLIVAENKKMTKTRIKTVQPNTIDNSSVIIKIQKDIELKEKEISLLNEQMNGKEQDFIFLNDLYKQKEKLTKEIEELYQEWDKLIEV